MNRAMSGFILYAGPSMLDGQMIVCIITNPKQARINPKTSEIVQTYIFRADVGPVEAVRSGADVSVCGDCRHRGQNGRGRSCYVQLWGGPRNIWLAHARGKYPVARDYEAERALRGRVVRMGSYGDPAALPATVWREAIRGAAAVVGYTHQWRSCDPEFADWCMASCDTEEERWTARALGWRTFRVRSADAPRLDREVICPASIEAGKLTNCGECRACGGNSARARADIVIVAHGDKGKVRNFERSAV